MRVSEEDVEMRSELIIEMPAARSGPSEVVLPSSNTSSLLRTIKRKLALASSPHEDVKSVLAISCQHRLIFCGAMPTLQLEMTTRTHARVTCAPCRR